MARVHVRQRFIDFAECLVSFCCVYFVSRRVQYYTSTGKAGLTGLKSSLSLYRPTITQSSSRVPLDAVVVTILSTLNTPMTAQLIEQMVSVGIARLLEV